MKELVAVVADEKMTRAEMLMAALIENMARENMTGLEKGEALKKYKKETGKNYAEIAEKVGLSLSRVEQLVRLAEQPVAIKRLLEIPCRARNRSESHKATDRCLTNPKRNSDLPFR